MFIVLFFGKVVFTSVRLASDLPLFAINSCSGLNEWWLSKREIPVLSTELVNVTSFGKLPFADIIVKDFEISKYS